MKNRLAFATLSLLTFSLPLLAHHGNAAFDTSKRVTVKGTVIEWLWANPHCVLTFDAKDESGKIVRWNVEAGIPSDMVRRGWAKSSVSPGDEVTVTMTPAKNGRPLGRLEKLVTSDGRTFSGGIPPDSPTEAK